MSLREPAEEHSNRHHVMAPDQTALLEVLDELKVADVGARVRHATQTIYQALIKIELTEVIGAARHEAATLA